MEKFENVVFALLQFLAQLGRECAGRRAAS
jgi:hypothetical protein